MTPLLKSQNDNSLEQATTFTRAELNRNFSRYGADRLINNDSFRRIEHGIYAKTDNLIDPFSVLHLKYQRGIFCLNTALYLWGYSDRYPEVFDMMFPQGYNTSNVTDEIKAHTQIEKYFSQGIKEVKTNDGNVVPVYSLERTLAEILRPQNHFDVELASQAYKQWAKVKNKDINSVIMFAEQFKVIDKLQSYMEVLL